MGWPQLLRYQLGILPWSPLAMGMLAGRYDDTDEFPDGSRAARIGAWAAERISQAGLNACREIAGVAADFDLTPAQLALVWAKDQAGVTSPIIGPRTEAHLDDALAVLEMNLEVEAASALDQIVPPGSAVADFHNTSGWMKMRVGPTPPRESLEDLTLRL